MFMYTGSGWIIPSPTLISTLYTYSASVKPLSTLCCGCILDTDSSGEEVEKEEGESCSGEDSFSAEEDSESDMSGERHDSLEQKSLQNGTYAHVYIHVQCTWKYNVHESTSV